MEGRGNRTQDSVATQLSQRVRLFYSDRTISGLTWTTFVLLNLANIITLINYVAPGWGWTHEISMTDVLEGEYYGYYGIWWSCWELMSGEGIQSCSLMADLPRVPGWYRGIQALATIVFLLSVAAFAVLGAYMLVPNFNKNSTILSTFIVLDVSTGLLNVALFVTYCTQFLTETYWCCDPDIGRQVVTRRLWYCFILSCIATAVYLAAAISGVFEAVTVKKDMKKRILYEQAHLRSSHQDMSYQERPNMMFRPPYTHMQVPY